MDGNKSATETTIPAVSGRGERHRRWPMTGENVRYFLPKPGSSPEKPELGQEMAQEGDALIEAFKSNQVFYTLVAWKAVPEINGGDPKIVRQALKR
jgi:hypothetical protein